MRRGWLVRRRTVRAPRCASTCAPSPMSVSGAFAWVEVGSVDPDAGTNERLEVGDQAGAPAREDVEEDPGARLFDHPQRHRRGVVVLERRCAEHVAQHAGRLDPHEDRLVGRDLAQHQRQVLGVLDVGGVDQGTELAGDAAEPRPDLRLGDRTDQHLLRQPVLDEVGDIDDDQVVLARRTRAAPACAPSRRRRA